jgi:decaprenylphospho-beta-D-ribofuranose 2-oxidase
MPEGTVVSGWGRTAPSRATVVAPRTEAEVEAALAGSELRGVIARGLGRSYGDAAQCAGGTVLDMRNLSEVGDVDPATGDVTAAAGASLDELVRRFLPAGWFPPVTPGTRQVTVGGAIAADVHGKNHHRDGSFARHVGSLTVATPTGTRTVTPGDDGELFWGSAGAMGLTGVVTRATLRLLAVETDRMVVDTDRFDDLDALMAAMEDGDAGYRYSVAWVDCNGRGGRSGRSVLTRGDHARREDLPPAHRGRPPRPPGRPRVRVGRPGPSGLLNPVTVAAFNELWYRRAPRRRRGELQAVASFFHPLDGVADWNLLYGRRGFLQYQFVVGPDRGDVVSGVIERLGAARIPSFLAVLKRFGPASPGPLSFPVPGWTLALDLPFGPPTLAAELDRLDEMVAEAGGRVYLAKDSRLRPDLVATMYPRLGELAALRRRVDPEGMLRSDLARRLGVG